MNNDIPACITRQAYAKINLGIRILRKRADGYHDIETVFARILPCDEIILKQSDAIILTCTQPDLPTDENNLCIKAAELLRQQFGVSKGVHITLGKQIPVGAGLGGGSSDAAATLLGLAQLWHLESSIEMLSTLALKLGSDVPYFLHDGTAHATGRGEMLDFVDLEIPYWIVLVYPNIHVSTAWAYREIDMMMSPTKGTTGIRQSSLKDLVMKNIHHPELLRKTIVNDFESVVMKAYPPIAQIKQELYDSGAIFAQMSGSGSSVYGFFESKDRAASVVRQFEKRYVVFLTPPNFSPEK